MIAKVDEVDNPEKHQSSDRHHGEIFVGQPDIDRQQILNHCQSSEAPLVDQLEPQGIFVLPDPMHDVIPSIQKQPTSKKEQ